MICIALFGKQESLESSQKSWNLARNLGILARFRITSKKIHSVGPLGLISPSYKDFLGMLGEVYIFYSKIIMIPLWLL